ncbi:MAG: hydrogenase formation protein HypD [Phycisphaerales bacterium]|nr:hydrogenase formation protein HypD [Phycisphaerales bacterium]MCB9854369.1 hydrogenase formation protein HypD [Phycisphaerales bacterium]MCB9863570.1 hydrogenase formation protein HypD [Phycisphaerales bacterium]
MHEMQKLRVELNRRCDAIGREIRVMEVCGTHTVAAFRSGIRSMLPDNFRLISGPGCPVCVTAQRYIDAAIDLASLPNVIVATYGDMLRVPGLSGSLEKQRAKGADLRVVTSALRALQIARDHPESEVVFLGVGFETTSPATALTILEAARDQVPNFSVLVSHKLVVPAMVALLECDDMSIDGFLCPGHVSVIIGSNAYAPIASRFGKPCVVGGFEPEQILKALVHLTRQIEYGESYVENVYPAVVTESGNATAMDILRRVFVPGDTVWRALGVIPMSGFDLAPEFQAFDALRRFDIHVGEDFDNPSCRCGEVILGRIEPCECALFGNECTPLTPIGPCMVSSEGTCAAWFKYNRHAIAMGARS